MANIKRRHRLGPGPKGLGIENEEELGALLGTLNEWISVGGFNADNYEEPANIGLAKIAELALKLAATIYSEGPIVIVKGYMGTLRKRIEAEEDHRPH